MAEKLTDSNKPAHEIIEVLEDGDAIRNDGMRLTAANKNPWYVLATIYGEQEEGGSPLDFDWDIEAKNRRAWNGWVCADIDKEECKVRAKKAGLDEADLMPLSKDELAGITKEFRKRLKDENAELPDRAKKIDFSKVHFSRPVTFANYIFDNYCDFSSSTFSRVTNFQSAMFRCDVNFKLMTFSRYTNFRLVTFNLEACFNSAVFGSYAHFESTKFKGVARFRFAIFNGDAAFKLAKFGYITDFSFATFKFEANFRFAMFNRDAIFSSAKFEYDTMFADARFLTEVPQFHAAELYENTVFPTHDKDQQNWPPLRGHVTVDGEKREVMSPADQKRAYNRLRLFMNKSLQIDEEQFFHRQEMRCKTVLSSWYHKPFYWLYALLSDYGNSVWRPLLWMLAVMLSGALFMLWWQEAFTFLPKESSGFDWTLGLLGEDDPWVKPRQAAGWSISNTLPFLGFGKLYYGELAKDLAWPLKVAGGVQTLLGYVLLFFFGLGLRNRFRLR